MFSFIPEFKKKDKLKQGFDFWVQSIGTVKSLFNPDTNTVMMPRKTKAIQGLLIREEERKDYLSNKSKTTRQSLTGKYLTRDCRNYCRRRDERGVGAGYRKGNQGRIRISG